MHKTNSQSVAPDFNPSELSQSELSQPELSQPELRKPKRFQVLLRNDDYTTMEFVIEVLRDFFAKSEADAHAIMLKVHLQGEGICGVYSRDIAHTKAAQVIKFARQNDQPLMCLVRECED